MVTRKTQSSWEDLIIKYKQDNKLYSRSCKLHNRCTQISLNDSDRLCPCGSLVRCHSFWDPNLQNREKNFNFPDNSLAGFKFNDSTTTPVTIFGRLKPNDCKFIRLDVQSDMNNIYQLLVDDSGGQNPKPDLILSIYGGTNYFNMVKQLEKRIICDLIDAVITTNAWILTNGVDNGVAKLVGECISYHCLLTEISKKIKCIGLTMWGTVTEDMRCRLKYESHDYPKNEIYRQTPDNVQEHYETIQKNHTHCILFDDEKFNTHNGDSHRHNLVLTACKDKDHT
ncbi:unnamed protein product, partial [Rotaria sp. Silwood2]